jgi:hypothetical protein
LLNCSGVITKYGQNDARLGIGSGLSDLEAGLRLRYEIHCEFALYIGVNWNKGFGNKENLYKFNLRNDPFDIEIAEWAYLEVAELAGLDVPAGHLMVNIALGLSGLICHLKVVIITY